MKWNKLGLVFCPNKEYSWMYSHAAVPIPIHIKDDMFRIIFSTRDKQNKSYPGWVEIDLNNPKKILNVSKEPLLLPSKNQEYDMDGVMPSCFLKESQKDLMYYIGWNATNTDNNVPFQNSIGLALKDKKTGKYQKHKNNPIVSKDSIDPIFVASCWVIKDENIYKMWYLSCTKWEKKNNVWKHFYHIRYAESVDGIEWDRNGKVAIDFAYSNEYAISRPMVIKENSKYKMWYSYRGGNLSELYRIGYAESNNGINWIRKDDKVGINISKKGWDSEMIEYPFIFDHEGKRYMLYNGNGYGKTGFGLAVLIQK